MSDKKLSVVISAYNNQDLIKDCLESVKNIADEILVVDNGSTDNTIKISKKYTKNIQHHKNNLLVLNQAKNYGFTKAEGNWILSLDPDERVSKKLAGEIASIIKNPQADAVGYQMPRQNIIFGKWIKHGLWYPDEQIRLFQKNKGKFAEKHNHEKLQVDGNINSLKGHLVHFNYTSVSQYVDKLNHMYSDNEAKNLIDSGKKVNWYDAIRMPLSDFLSNFFAREAYKDGLHGLVLSLMQAFYTFVVFAKVWEKQQFNQYQDSNFLKLCRTEFESKLKEFEYWYAQKQSSIKDFPQKISSKLSLKIQSIIGKASKS